MPTSEKGRGTNLTCRMHCEDLEEKKQHERERKLGDLPAYRPNAATLLAANSFLVEEAEKFGHQVTRYEIVKSIFKADGCHLDELGRPLPSDKYIAKEHGRSATWPSTW